MKKMAKVLSLLFILFLHSQLTGQITNNPPATGFIDNLSSGTYVKCAYNANLSQSNLTSNVNYTIRAGESVRIQAGGNPNSCHVGNFSGGTFRAYVDPNYNLSGCQNVSGSLVWDAYYSGDGSIVRYKRPVDYQLYPRKSDNYGDVVFAATTSNVVVIKIRITKTDFNNSISFTENLIGVSNNHFSYTFPIHAELSEYKFEYQLNATGPFILIADRVVCGDAYIISGQSNAETGDLDNTEVTNLNAAYGSTTSYGKYSRSFGGTYHYNFGWSVSNSNLNNQGHVGAWGLPIQYKIQQTYGIPTCVINGAVGGTSIGSHLPDPNEPFFNPFTNPTNGNRFFSHLNSRIYHAGLENNIAGILWWQGDGNGAKYNQNTPSYADQFAPLYDLWDTYFPNFKKAYVVQIASWVEAEDGMREGSESQRTLPLVFNKLAVMSSNGIAGHRNDQPQDQNGRHVDGPGGCCGRHTNCSQIVPVGNEIHHQAGAYEELSTRLFRLLEADQYGKTTNINDIYPPNIVSATIHNSTVKLNFNQNISTTNSDPLDKVLEMVKVYDVNNPSTVYTLSNPGISGTSFTFNVSSSSGITHVSYLGFLPGKAIPFNGDFACYLKNSKSVAALSFHNIPVLPEQFRLNMNSSNEAPVDGEGDNLQSAADFLVYPNPFSNQLSITNTQNRAIESFILTDITGKVILDQKNVSGKTVFNIPELEPGIYFISINNNKNQIKKIIKINN